MKIELFHDTNFQNNIINKHQCNFLYGPFVHAGTIEAETIEEAYYLSQNSNYLWITNKAVQATGLSNRSTMIGDVMVFKDTFYVIHRIGFREISLEEMTHFNLTK
jgi:hypothetical protein